MAPAIAPPAVKATVFATTHWSDKRLPPTTRSSLRAANEHQPRLTSDRGSARRTTGSIDGRRRWRTQGAAGPAQLTDLPPLLNTWARCREALCQSKLSLPPLGGTRCGGEARSVHWVSGLGVSPGYWGHRDRRRTASLRCSAGPDFDRARRPVPCDIRDASGGGSGTSCPDASRYGEVHAGVPKHLPP